jgi:hypothetical protein
MLFKLSRWQNKALANKTRHDVYGAPTDCSDTNQVSNMNGDANAKATKRSEKFSADNHTIACHIAEKKQDRHSFLENVLTRNQSLHSYEDKQKQYARLSHRSHMLAPVTVPT